MVATLPESNVFHGRRVCGFDDSSLPMGDGVCKWPIDKLRWSYNKPIPTLPENDFKDAVVTASGFISEVCGLEFEYTSNPRTANIILDIFRGSPGGELAHAYLPCGPVNANTQLQLNFDTADAWVIAQNPPPNKIDLVRVALHELMHNCGIPHLSGGVAIMNPTYNAAIWKPQTLDIAELVRRYGMPKRRPEPTPTPVPQPNPQPSPNPGSGGGQQPASPTIPAGQSELVSVSFLNGKFVARVASGVTVKLANGTEIVS